MSDFGNWKAEGVTYIGILQGELFDGDTGEVIGEQGQTQIVCDDAVPMNDEEMDRLKAENKNREGQSRPSLSKAAKTTNYNEDCSAKPMENGEDDKECLMYRTLLNDAADEYKTVLREKKGLLRELLENSVPLDYHKKKLRHKQEYLDAAIKRRDYLQEQLSLCRSKLKSLESENAKLRGLAKAAWGCVNRRVSCDECRMVCCGCTLQSAMRELGIEVDFA